MGQNERMNELQYQDVSTYLRAWYKGKKNDSPIELGSDLQKKISTRYELHSYELSLLVYWDNLAYGRAASYSQYST